MTRPIEAPTRAPAAATSPPMRSARSSPLRRERSRLTCETCAVCRDELAAFQQVVDALPMSAPRHRGAAAPAPARDVGRCAARPRSRGERAPAAVTVELLAAAAGLRADRAAGGVIAVAVVG